MPRDHTSVLSTQEGKRCLILRLYSNRIFRGSFFRCPLHDELHLFIFLVSRYFVSQLCISWITDDSMGCAGQIAQRWGMMECKVQYCIQILRQKQDFGLESILCNPGGQAMKMKIYPDKCNRLLCLSHLCLIFIPHQLQHKRPESSVM